VKPMAEPTQKGSHSSRSGNQRVLLCVVDDSEELSVALEFASLRARRTNARVALLYVIDKPTEFQHWASIGDLMREEARDEAEQRLQRAAAQVQRWSGKMPILYIREGPESEEVIKLVEEEPDISILVLAASVDPQGPGPLVSSLTGKSIGRMRVPIVIVPGNLSDEELELLA